METPAQTTAEQAVFAHLSQVLERELQPHGKEEKCHPDLGQDVDLFLVGNPAQTMRADKRAANQEAKHRRKLEPLECEHNGD